MAFTPIAYIAPNYRDFKNDWLKAYEPGTTTPKVMALDSSGSTTVAKLQLNADGFLASAGAALVIPYIEDAYDLWLFPTEAEADANDTSNAERLADNLETAGSALINDLSQTYTFDTVSLFKVSLIEFPDGKTIHLNDRNADFTKITGIGAATGYKIIGSTSVNQSIDLITTKGHNLNQYGAGNAVIADDNVAIQEAVNNSGDGGYITCNSNSSFETSVPIEGTGSRVIDLLNAEWVYSGTGGTILRLQPNSLSTVANFATPVAMTVTQASFQTTPPELVNVVIGDIIELQSTDVNLVNAVDGDYLKGQVIKVTKNSGGVVQFYPNIVDDFSATAFKIAGKTEGTNVKNVNIDCTANVSNNSILDIILHSSVEIENFNIIGSGFQNIGVSAKGVDINIENCSIVGVANDNNAPGYGVATSGSNITVKGVSGTKCRHLVDGGSRAYYTVGLAYIGIHASKDDGASDNNYILGFHANCRGFSVTGGSVTGNGALMAIRGGEGTIQGVQFLSTGSNIYADITINEEGARKVVIDGNTFGNANGVSGNTCVRLSTSQDNKSLVVTNNSVAGDDKVLVELRNNGFNTAGVLIDGNTGTPDKLLFTTTSTALPSPKDLEVTISNNDLTAADSEAGYYVSFIEDFNNLTLTLSNNNISYLTGSGMLGISGDITGDLVLDIGSNNLKDSTVDSFFIKPSSVTGNMGMNFSHNRFSGQFEFDAIPATFTTMHFIGNTLTNASDAIVFANDDTPVIIQNNMTQDSQSWRQVRTLYPEGMIGNVNTAGSMSANGYRDFGVWNYADGSWRSDADPDTLPLDFKGIEFMRRRTYAIGTTTGYAFDGANWTALANL